ncbi:glycosyltransferase involved in cell wall biosynthesis [Paenibacillus forsythiae]|uniref:Glycosyltransferase involved in cell wall biosynthesis n=1 Tax=Paenibacillus forsythiae TaxID=365616 RepID=A0ABU3HDA9_9BACL|nr:glycosyltransferase [Paenibacillus forsythiae]MDT3428801.1 glycosyltransferase involved in cell wall biosynthesis [Paenibacillus forsythiae]
MRYNVSVIIPVFNAELYLDECIRSLQAQTLKSCEFIFVNDGSADGSRAIIEAAMEDDSRIRLINQENHGVSVARNRGLAIAAGEYVGFVDADDYIESGMYHTLYGQAVLEGCDAVVSNLESEIEGRPVVTRYPFDQGRLLDREFIRSEILPRFLRSDDLNTSVNKLYKRSVITEYSLKFPEKVALGEDALFNIHFFARAASMRYIDYTGYHYREVQGSATRNILDKDYFGQALRVYHTEPPEIYRELLPEPLIKRLQAVRFIKTAMACIYIYLKPSGAVKFRQRYRYISQIINNPHVREALPVYFEAESGQLGRFEKATLWMIRTRLTLGLVGIAAYSRLRNA